MTNDLGKPEICRIGVIVRIDCNQRRIALNS